MNLTFIVTVDPVKDLTLLNFLVHSLNLQTQKRFNVVFYNQTLSSWATVLSRLSVTPSFDHSVSGVDGRHFLGRYPIWDLYELHHTLLERNALNEYFISLHMEEFLDADYVEHVLPVLETHRLDILFANLSRTSLTTDTGRPLLAARTAHEFGDALHRVGAGRAPHWSLHYCPFQVLRRPGERERCPSGLPHLRLRRRLRPTAAGYTPMPTYHAEDVYWMSRDFARRHNWFLKGHHLYFEDIHICQQKGVCELAPVLQRLTRFPLYFNRRRLYHVPHRRYYYQLVDAEFTARLLDHPSTDPVLDAHKTAIRRYRHGQFTLEQALRYTRQNPEGTGTQNLNYRYHMLYVNRGPASDAAGSAPADRP